MLYDSKFKYVKGKTIIRWLGPYLEEKCHENGSIQIRTIDEEGIPLLVNSHWLKLYRRPLSKEEFISSVKKRIKCDWEFHIFQSMTFLEI